MPIATARPRSAPIISGRRRIRSTTTPKNSIRPRTGNSRAAPSSPICVAVACRYSTAVNGNASVVTWVPKAEMLWPSQSRLKSRRRRSSSPARVSGTVSCVVTDMSTFVVGARGVQCSRVFRCSRVTAPDVGGTGRRAGRLRALHRPSPAGADLDGHETDRMIRCPTAPCRLFELISTTGSSGGYRRR